jgi:carbonic anhydrase
MIEKLIHGHQNFQERFFAGERKFLRGLVASTQAPAALYVGCSDSRIVPELLTSAAPGELFVVRNVANLVPTFAHADCSVGAALEYAVGYLATPHVIVCGHYGCGGVKAAVEGLQTVKEHASLHEWLEGVLPAVQVLKDEELDAETRWRRAVEENVIEQLSNLVTYPTVAAALQAGKLEMHGWTFDPVTTQLYVYDVDSDRFVRSDELL